MSLSDYSSLEKEIRDAPEPKVLPVGTEVKVRIIAVREGLSAKNNNAKYYQPVYDVPDNPLVIEWNDFLWDLADRGKLDEKKQVKAIRRFKMFAECFGLDFSRPFSWTEDLIGLTGWMIVGVQHDAQYGDKNSVSKYVAGSTPQARAQSAASSVAVDDDIPF